MVVVGRKGRDERDSRIAPLSNAPGYLSLIGRETELSELFAALENSLECKGQTVALVGEPGIGKTLLMTHIKQQAEVQNATVISATCSSLPGAPPLWPWVEVFSNFESAQEITNTNDLVLAELDQGSAERRFELFANMVSVIRAESTKNPILICLDDLHWADTSSLELLSFAATQLNTAAVLIVASLRTAEAEAKPAARNMLASLSRLDQFTRIEPRTLDTGETQAVVESAIDRTITHEVASKIAEKSRGIPLFVQELARQVDNRGQSLSGGLPNQIKQALGVRLDTLGSNVQTWLQAAAILGHSFRPSDVTQILVQAGLQTQEEVSVETTLGIVDQAISAGLLRASLNKPGQFEFAHPLFSEVSRERLPVSSAVKLHAATASMLEETYGARAAEWASELAWHFKEALPSIGFEKMIHYSLVAGRSALRSFAWAEALEHFENVRGVVEASPNRIELAHAWLGISRARHTYESKWGSSLTAAEIETGLATAFDIFIEQGETGLAIETASQGIIGEAGWSPGASLAERALELTDNDSVATARLLSRYADVIFSDRARSQESQPVFDRAFKMAARHDDVDLQLRILRIQAQFRMFEKRYSEAINLRDQALKLRKPGADSIDMALLHMQAGMAEGSLGNMVQARRSLEAGKQISDELGIEVILYHLVKANFASAQARFDEAVEQALELERLNDHAPITRFFELLQEAYTGDIRKALQASNEYLEGIPVTAQAMGHRAVYGFFILWTGIEIGDSSTFHEANEIANEMKRLAANDPTTVLAQQLLEARLAASSGDTAVAQREYEKLLPESGTFNMFCGGLVNDLVLAELSITLGDQEKAIDHLSKGYALARASGIITGQCETAKAYAAALLKRGTRVDVAQAVEILKDGIEVANRHNLKHLRVTMTEMLEKSTQGRTVYPAGLTSREIDVVRLIVDGKSNPQIAEELFISLNTVLRHVSNIFGKLNVSSRTEAAIKAVEIGVAEKG